MESGVTVTGSGTAATRPDIARAGLTVAARGAEVAGALDAASAAMDAVVAALTEHGVDESDVAADGLSVQQAWASSGQSSGFDCSQQIRVVLRDIDTAGRILRAMAAAGGDRLRINDLRLDVSDRTAVAEEARAAAFADARSRAEQYAGLSGRGLGAVLAIDESSGASSPGYGRTVFLAAAAPAGRPIPIAAGGLEVQVSVTVRWALLD